MITKTIPISTRTVMKQRYAMKQNIHFEFDKKSMEIETRCLRISQWREATVEQILVSEERNPKEHDCENHSQEID